MDKSEGFIMAGGYNVFARSVSGLETTVVLRKISEKFNVCFDMGIACRENQSCDRVFIRYLSTNTAYALMSIFGRHCASGL